MLKTKHKPAYPKPQVLQIATGIFVFIALSACGAAASVSPPPSSPEKPPSGGAQPSSSAQPAVKAAEPAASQVEWDRVLAAAKQEGSVSVLVSPGEPVRQALTELQKKYGISVQLLAGSGSTDLAPRVAAERQGGQFLWDAAVLNSITLYRYLKPIGCCDPLRPALILPEVTDDSKWMRGFAAGWSDQDKSTVYVPTMYRLWSVYINRSIVPEAQLSKMDQLWEPQWKGRIALQDPRVGSSGAGTTQSILAVKGEDRLRSFLQNQQPALTQDRRQLAEWVVRGQYPIGLGVSVDVLSGLVSQGLDIKTIAPLMDPDPAGWLLSGGTGAVALFNRAPHPNAAKVLINWLISREGQALWSDLTKVNTRRTDVPIVDPLSAVDPKMEMTEQVRKVASDFFEETFPIQGQAIAIAKEVLK